MANENIYQSRFTGAEMDAFDVLTEELAAAIAALELAVAAKYSKPQTGIPASDLDADVNAALAKANSAIQSLADYYTKSEVDAMMSAVNSQEYETAATLPTASASTMGKIYLIGPDGSGYYSYYFTSYDGSAYSWVGPLGTTEIDLSQYASKAELNQLDQKVVKKDNDSEVKIQDGTDRIYIADADDNAILKIDKDGLHATDIDVDRLNHQDNGQYNEFFYLLDPVGNVILKADKDGLHTVSVDAKNVLKNSWGGKVMATYGDSITAVNNGDFSFPFTPNEYNWGNEVAKFFSFAKNYGRGIGSTCFKYRDHGGQVAWVDTVTGNYVNRDDNYTYDNYQGHITIPDGCTAIRGDGSSWLRLSSMFPASIRGTIDVVMVMFLNDFHYDMDTDVVWIPNDTTDPEWAASDEYSALGGDYNIDSVKGGIASVVMKLQALMPQATIVLMTPIGGVYTSSGQKSGNFNNEETANMKKLADVVMDVAQRMSTPCINVYGTCGINTLNRTTYITDTIHPYTVAGRKKIGRAVSSGLIQQICL